MHGYWIPWISLVFIIIINAMTADGHQIARITVTDVHLDIFPDRFFEWYLIDVQKIGLPGRSFQLAINWTTDTICVAIPWFEFSDSFRNGTDVVYLPRSATRLPLTADPAQCAPPGDANGIIGFGPASPIWDAFGIVTIDLTLRNHPAGIIVLGQRNPESFAELNGPRLFVHCDVFPSKCWLPGVLWSQSVRVLFAVGEHTILLGRDLWSQFVNDSSHVGSPLVVELPNQPIASFTVNQLTEIDEDRLEKFRGTERWARLAHRVRFESSDPDWTVLRRPIVHLCEHCELPTDVVLGTMTLGVAIILNAEQKHLEIGAQYERSRWTIWNISFLFVLVCCLLHFYMNPATQLPAFMNHENEADPRAVFKIENRTFVHRLRHIQHDEMDDEDDDEEQEEDEADEDDNDEKDVRKVEHSRRRELLRSRRQAAQKKMELKQRLLRIHQQLFSDSKSRIKEVFGCVTLGPEILGIVTIFVTLIVNVAFLNFGRRVQFVLLVPSDAKEATGEPALIMLLVVTLGILFLVHMVFFLATPPCHLHRPFGASPRPSLLLLVRRAVAEASLHVGIWITLVEGPLETYYQLLSFLNCMRALYSNALYLSMYLHHLAVRKHWVLTSMLIVIHLLLFLLFGAFSLQPLLLLMWQRYEDTTTAWLLTLNMYAILWLLAAFTQRFIARRELEYVELVYRSIGEFETQSRVTSVHENSSVAFVA